MQRWQKMFVKTVVIEITNLNLSSLATLSPNGRPWPGAGFPIGPSAIRQGSPSLIL